MQPNSQSTMLEYWLDLVYTYCNKLYSPPSVHKYERWCQVGCNRISSPSRINILRCSDPFRPKRFHKLYRSSPTGHHRWKKKHRNRKHFRIAFEIDHCSWERNHIPRWETRIYGYMGKLLWNLGKTPGRGDAVSVQLGKQPQKTTLQPAKATIRAEKVFGKIEQMLQTFVPTQLLWQ